MTENFDNVLTIEEELSSDTSNIVKALPTYNKNKVETTIRELKRELKEQRDINSILKSEKYQEKGKQIKDFIERNEGEITEQISRLGTVISDLKNIVTENNSLNQSEEKYDELISSDDSIRVARKIATLKALKKDICDFLEDSNITVPTLN